MALGDARLGRRDLELFSVVNNLVDRKPPLTPSGGVPGLVPPSFVNTYDILSRYITVGVRLEL